MPRRRNPRQLKRFTASHPENGNALPNRRRTKRKPSLSPPGQREQSPDKNSLPTRHEPGNNHRKHPTFSESDDSIRYIKTVTSACSLKGTNSHHNLRVNVPNFKNGNGSTSRREGKSCPEKEEEAEEAEEDSDNIRIEKNPPRRLPPPVKPLHDPKAYRIIQLDNGMKVALISDMSSEEGGTIMSSENTPGVQLPTNNSDYVFFRPRESSSLPHSTNAHAHVHGSGQGQGQSGVGCSWCRSFFNQPSSGGGYGTKEFSIRSEAEQSESSAQNNFDLPGFSTGKCAVAACVGVGYLNDPPNCQGLAHLCEHMVFMGSSEFESEDHFMSFIKENGGTFNALTSAEYTKYQFDTSARSLDQALEIFSNFFKKPLFTVDSIKREVENVDHEFRMKKQSDCFSRMELLHSTAKKNHPYRTFACGCTETLAKNCEESDYENLKGHLETFHQKYYTAPNLTLAIRGRMQLNDLENLVLKHFSQLTNSPDEDNFTLTKTSQRNRNAVPSKLKNPFDTPDFTQRILVEPVGAIDSLYLTWALPPSTWQNYSCKPLAYLSSVISSEVSGGLVDYLKTRKWVLDLRCGVNFDSCTKYGVLFTIRMYITDEGYAHQDEVIHNQQKNNVEILNTRMTALVIQAVYVFISKLKDLKPSRLIYEDISSIKKSYLDNYGCNGSLVETVEKLAAALHLFPTDKLITGDKLLFNFDADAISSAMSYLVVENMNIMVFSHGGAGDTGETSRFTKVEPYLKIKYDCEEIGGEQFRLWKKLDPSLRSKFRNPLQTNRYKTNEFTLYHRGLKYPEIQTICKNEHTIAAWLPLAVHFPFAMFRIALSSNQGPLTGNQMSMLHIWASMLKFELREAIGLAREAGVYCMITAQDSFLAVEIYGFDKKALQLAREILSEISKKTVLKDEIFFSVCKQFTLKMCHYALLHPFCMANQLLRRLKLFGCDSAIDVHSWLLQTSHTEFKNFIQNFMSKMKLCLWVGGNTLRDDVELFTQDFEQNFELNGLKRCYNSIYSPRIVSFPHANLIYRVQSINLNHSTSMLINYHQFGLATPQAAALIKPLISMMEVPFFNEIRTKKTLGYAVSCAPCCDQGVLGAVFFVCTDAEKFRIETVSKEIESFIDNFYRTAICPMSEEDYEKLCGRFPSLRMANLNLLKKMYVELLFPRGKFYSKMSVQVVGHKKDPCVRRLEPKSSHGQDYQSPIELKTVSAQGDRDDEDFEEGGRKVIWVTDIDQLHQHSLLFPLVPRR